jgi:hypothetical protein
VCLDGKASAALLPRLRGPASWGALRQESGYFCAEPSWSTRAPRARRPPREHPKWPSYGHYGRPTALWRHHGTRTSAHGHPRAVPSPGGAGSRRPRPRIRPPPKNNSKTRIAPTTPELTDKRGGFVPPVGAHSSGNNCGRRTDDTTMRPQDAPLQKKKRKFRASDIFTIFSNFGGKTPF